MSNQKPEYWIGKMLLNYKFRTQVLTDIESMRTICFSNPCKHSKHIVLFIVSYYVIKIHS